MRFEETYGDSATYLVEPYYDEQYIFAVQVTNRVTGYGFGLSVITGSSSRSEHDPVQAILIFPYVEEESNLRSAVLPDLYGVLGDVQGIDIPHVGSDLLTTLFYKEYHVGITITPLPCRKVLLNHEIHGIGLFDSTYIEETSGISELNVWRGFGRCYEV